MPGDDVILDVTGYWGTPLGVVKMRMHPGSQCEDRGFPCCIHSPGGHHMRDWPMRWRSDIYVMMRMCPHGQEHPDPDHIRYMESQSETLAGEQERHPCDRCCEGA